VTYFQLRKRDLEPEPEEAEEEPEETTEDDAEGEQPAGRGPLLTGFLGPGQWIAARFGTGAAWGVHGVAVWAIGFYGGWAAAGIVVVWLLAVLAFVPREYLERLAARIEKRSPEEDQEAGEGHPGEPLAAVLWQLIGDAPGTHLKTVAEHLQAAAPELPLDRAAVRAKMGALGIPVRASVRDAAGRVNEGVHRDDLEAWAEALSPTGPGTPPEPRSAPVATPLTCDVADAPTTVATPRPRLRRLLSRGGA
jgi:hypothetical protein